MSHASPAKHAPARVKARSAASAPTPQATRKPTGLVRAGSRSVEVIAFEDLVVSFFIDAADMLGVPKSVAAIYGICFASPQALSFSEINERLEISSGSISQGLRVLREVGALKVADGRDVRSAETPEADISASRDLSISVSQRPSARYEPDLELRNLMLHWIEKRLQNQLTSGRTRLQQIVDSIPQIDGGSDTLKTRCDSLQTWQDKAHSLLPIAKGFLKLT